MTRSADAGTAISRRRLPAFHPVPLRGRADGWTPHRQAVFIGWLAATGSVLAAAGAVGLSRESAYRLRRRPGAEGFAAAWASALGRAAVLPVASRRKVTVPLLLHRVEQGTVRPVLTCGQFSHVAVRADNSALLALLARFDRAAARSAAAARTSATKMRGKCQLPCPLPPLPPI